MANVDITIKTIDQNTIQTAKQIQSSMDGMKKSLKEAGVSQQAYNQALKQSQQTMQQSKMSWTELNSAISVAKQALEAVKKVYNFSKEGAQIDFLQGKFSRLAESIGTTSDVLMGDLREATKGTLSDMQLMASVTDIVGLGLVNTSEDAVRLSKVVAGLGMDMNQLVLTLANKTTMRFDQLGVAVVGFDEKVKRLKETGMSADEAFTQAFLSQAEEQLQKVGNAADTALGSFQRFEAQSGTAWDRFKVEAMEATEPVIRALADVLQRYNETKEALEDLDPELQNVSRLSGTGAKKIEDLAYAHKYVSGMARMAAQMLREEQDALEITIDTVAMTEEELKTMTDTNRDFLDTVMDVSSAQEKYNDGLAEADKLLADGELTAEEHAAKVGELAGAYKDATNQIIADLLLMKMTADGVFDDTEIDNYLGALEKMGLITGDAADTARGYLGITESLNRGLELTGKAADDAGVGLDKITDPMTHVGKRAADAAIGIDAAGGALREVARPALDASGAIAEVTGSFRGLPPSGASWSYFFNIYTKGKVPNIPTRGTNSGPGAGMANNAGVDQEGDVYGSASGGMLHPNAYTIVGEGASGWSPTAEVITPWGEVIPHNEAQAMKDAGMLDGARRAAFGTDDYVSPGSTNTVVYNPSTAKPGGTLKPPKKGSVTGRIGGLGGGNASALADAAVSAAESAAGSAAAVSMQLSAVQTQIAQQQAQNAAVLEELRAINNSINTTGPRAVGSEVGYVVARRT